MRNLLVTLTLTAVLSGGYAQIASAQEETPGPMRQRMRQRREQADRPAADNWQGRLMQILNEEQRAKAEAILREARQKAQDAATPDQRQQIMQQAREQIMVLLTEDQKAQLRAAGRPMGRGLDLSDQQDAKIADIYKAAMDKIATCKNPADRIEIYKQLQKDLLGVLTEEQARKLREMRENGPGLNLTEQQRAELAEIAKAARLAMALANDPAKKREILKQARKDALAVLTKEQREKYRRLQQFLREPAGRPGQGPGPGGMGPEGMGPGPMEPGGRMGPEGMGPRRGPLGGRPGAGEGPRAGREVGGREAGRLPGPDDPLLPGLMD